MPKKKFYAVAVGRKTGVFNSWDDCKQQVHGFGGAKYKSFPTKNEAEQFVNGSAPPSKPKRSEDNTGGTLNKRQKLDDFFSGPKFASSVSKSSLWQYWFHMSFDGGARGNPGVAGAGTEIITRTQTKKNNEDNNSGNIENINETDSNPTIIKRTKTHIRTYLGDYFTNNQAEYEGVAVGMEFILKTLESNQSQRPNVTIVVQGDSKLIIQQLKGEYKCNSEKLKPIFQRVKKTIQKIRSVCSTVDFTFEHVYRNDNKTADALANAAMDARRSWTTSDGDNDSHGSRKEIPQYV